MTKVSIDTNELNNRVMPLFNESLSKLNESIKLLKESKTPINFKYNNSIKKILSDFDKNYNLLNDYKNGIEKNIFNVDKFNEKKLDEVIDIKKISIYKNGDL